MGCKWRLISSGEKQLIFKDTRAKKNAPCETILELQLVFHFNVEAIELFTKSLASKEVAHAFPCID